MGKRKKKDDGLNSVAADVVGQALKGEAETTAKVREVIKQVHDAEPSCPSAPGAKKKPSARQQSARQALNDMRHHLSDMDKKNAEFIAQTNSPLAQLIRKNCEKTIEDLRAEWEDDETTAKDWAVGRGMMKRTREIMRILNDGPFTEDELAKARAKIQEFEDKNALLLAGEEAESKPAPEPKGEPETNGAKPAEVVDLTPEKPPLSPMVRLVPQGTLKYLYESYSADLASNHRGGGPVKIKKPGDIGGQLFTVMGGQLMGDRVLSLDAYPLTPATEGKTMAKVVEKWPGGGYDGLLVEFKKKTYVLGEGIEFRDEAEPPARQVPNAGIAEQHAEDATELAADEPTREPRPKLAHVPNPLSKSEVACLRAALKKDNPHFERDLEEMGFEGESDAEIRKSVASWLGGKGQRKGENYLSMKWNLDGEPPAIRFYEGATPVKEFRGWDKIVPMVRGALDIPEPQPAGAGA
jgi:hypothetical protein